MKISPLNFNCKYYPSCVSRAQNKRKFTKGHGIWVGTEYEHGKIPKLLFLSLDSGSAELDPNKRTMEAAREWNLKWLPGKGDKPRHWYRTQQFAWHLFNEFNNAFNTALEIGNVDANYDFNPVTEIHKIKPYYAAANSAKCCMNNEGRKQANLTLFKNCKEYILGELEILRPDILVTQGDPARAVAEEMKKRTQLIKRENISQANKNKDDFHILKLTDGRTLLWIHHYHPTNFGAFKKNRDKYKTYAKKAAEFIKTSRIDANKSISGKTKDRSESLSDRAPETDFEAGKKQNALRRGDRPLIHRSGIEHREGSGTHLVVLVLEESWRKNEYLSVDDIALELSKSAAGRHLVSDGRVQDIKKRVKRVISWLSSEKYIIKKGNLIKLA